jgi:hypothetical protein
MKKGKTKVLLVALEDQGVSKNSNPKTLFFQERGSLYEIFVLGL